VQGGKRCVQIDRFSWRHNLCDAIQYL
jgi:hypothetical protein